MDVQEYQSVAAKLVETLNATVIPVGQNKNPGIGNWQRMTQAECLHPANLARFGPEFPSIGIVLGKASNHLCSIDLDSDELLAEFLACNPKLQGSLVSRGYRGGNVWVRVTGPYPPMSKIRRGREACGEWRADGGYTIIWGVHPSGKRYSCSEGMPVEISFAEIDWPEGCELKGKAGRSRKAQAEKQPNPKAPHAPPGYSAASSALLPVCTSTPLQHCATAPLHDRRVERVCDAMGKEDPDALPALLTPERILLHQQSMEKATAQLAKENPGLAKLYAQFMERRYEARPHARNEVIVESVPFLFRAVAEELIPQLLMHFHNCHWPLFEASLEEHMKEVRAMVHGVRNRYLESLPEGERALYGKLGPRIQTIYRICRDLAEVGESSSGPGKFFMSDDHMALRLNIDSQQAHRELRKLCSMGVMVIATKGTPRSAGVRGKATTYGWSLPL